MSPNELNVVTTFEPLSTSQRRGAIVVAVFALLSTLALAFIALRTIRLATVLFLKRNNNTSRPPEILFFRTQLGHYAGCLILSNMFISAAGLIDFSWVSRSGLSRGSTCSAQAVLMQIGIWGTCWFTAAHGVHTLSSLGFHIRPARWRSLTSVAIGWTIAFIAGLAPLQKSNVYGPTGTSCSITPSYPREIFVLEALPIILGVFVSAAVYSVIFIVLHGKLSVNNTQKLGDANSTSQREEDIFEEYYKFISMIIRTMFWFPFAFVLLLLPFCFTHILMYAGHSEPSASSVFADACASMLGFVNVGLLLNTFRVISPVYHGPRAAEVAAETVKTFGNDASGESPIAPQLKFSSQSAVPSYESSYRTYNSIQSSSNHLRNSSGSSVDSNTELLGADKASYESAQMKVASLVLNDIITPPKLSRQLGGDPGVILPQSNTKRQDINFQSEKIVNSPLRTASFRPRSPRVLFVTGDTRREPSTQDEKCMFHAFGRGARKPSFKSKAPAALNLPRLSVLPPPLSARETTNKSATLAARLGIPVASACIPSQTSAVFSAQILDKGNAGVSAFPVIPIPQIEVNTWGPENADESNSRSSPSASPASTVPLSADSDSDYWAEIMHVRKVRPLPQVPESSDNEQNTDGSYPPVLQFPRSRSCRTTMTSVWSQETGYTMNQLPDEESQEACRQLVANVLARGVILGDQGDVGGVMNRQATPGLHAHHKTLLLPINVASKFSTRFSNMLSPESPNSTPSPMIFAPNDSVV